MKVIHDMAIKKYFIIPIVYSVVNAFNLCIPGREGDNVTATSEYGGLVRLFHEFREFQQPETIEGVPDYSETEMTKQYRELKTYQNRLTAIDPGRWSVSLNNNALV